MLAHLINGNTLVIRTKQRNHLIMRLHGAAAFATNLGLSDKHIRSYEIKIEQLKKAQIQDRVTVTKQRRYAKLAAQKAEAGESCK